jgi:hypothetical protein
MSEIKLVCPACKKSHEISLKSGKSVLLLNCPECRCLLLHYGDATYQVRKSEIEEASRGKNLKSVHHLMEVISRIKADKGKPGIIPFKPRKIRKDDRAKGAGKGRRTEPLSKDEILNLIIDINTTSSVSEFLKKLK